MNESQIDVRDLDHTWWEKVEAYRDKGQLHLSRESVERIGEVNPDGTASLIDGHVQAKPGQIDGQPVWTVGADELVTRPSRALERVDRNR